MHVWMLSLVEASWLVFLVDVVVVIVVVVFVYLLSLLYSSLLAVLPTDPPTTTTQPPSTQPPPTPKKDVDSPNTVVVDIGNSGRSLAAQWRHAVNQRFCQFIPHFFTFLFYFLCYLFLVLLYSNISFYCFLFILCFCVSNDFSKITFSLFSFYRLLSTNQTLTNNTNLSTNLTLVAITL